MPSKVLVTGGCGFIGSHLVDRLVKEGKEVVVLDDLSGVISTDHIHTACTHVGSVIDKKILYSAMEGADVVYHIAGQSRVLLAEQHPYDTFQSNVMGTVWVLACAKALGVRRVVFTSSREVYGDCKQLDHDQQWPRAVNESDPFNPKNSYGASKAAAEVYCRCYRNQGLDVAVLRLSNVYGPRDVGRVIPTFVKQALAGESLVIYGGSQVLDFVWIGTVIECLYQAGYRQSPIQGPVNVGSGIGHSVLDVARHVIQLSGSKSQIVSNDANPEECSYYVADVRKMRREFGELPPPLFKGREFEGFQRLYHGISRPSCWPDGTGTVE